jgi:hypothetical protein
MDTMKRDLGCGESSEFQPLDMGYFFLVSVYWMIHQRLHQELEWSVQCHQVLAVQGAWRTGVPLYE